MLDEDFAKPPAPAPCTRPPATLNQPDEIRGLPAELDELETALRIILLNPQDLEDFRPVVRLFDVMGKPTGEQLARMLSEMTPAQRSLTMGLMHPLLRDRLKAMVRPSIRQSGIDSPP